MVTSQLFTLDSAYYQRMTLEQFWHCVGGIGRTPVLWQNEPPDPSLPYFFGHLDQRDRGRWSHFLAKETSQFGAPGWFPGIRGSLDNYLMYEGVDFPYIDDFRGTQPANVSGHAVWLHHNREVVWTEVIVAIWLMIGDFFYSWLYLESVSTYRKKVYVCQFFLEEWYEIVLNGQAWSQPSHRNSFSSGQAMGLLNSARRDDQINRMTQRTTYGLSKRWRCLVRWETWSCICVFVFF